uniref:Tripartite motif containing 66 n=1 Tax=Cynoglossus semilaevis TaxID=244447 RepID=A0A3P8VLP2_CYNSE
MEKICSECSEPTLAQSLCILCNKWFCYQCTDVHQHHRATVAPQFSDLHHHQKVSAAPCPEHHHRGSSPVPASGQGPGSYPCSLLMCHSHRQEPLELFCESCDLLCCSSCHLSSHKNHRLHGVKIAHRKAENQIKMAKMIMMNELNKRANLLIEQLEKISEEFQQRLEDQLQGAIEMCGQLDHVQKFITWATTHHRRGPLLFSKALLSLQMQQLLEPSLHPESWSPVKIKFDWDASYWMKEISTLGQLTVEGGNCTYPQGLSCSSLMRPQPITCLALPSVFHRQDPSCGYQSCCEPQMCCLHGLPSQQDLSTLGKGQAEVSFCNSSCVQPALASVPLHQSQQIPRCWDTEGSSHCPPPTPSVPFTGPTQLSCSRDSTSPIQSTDAQTHAQSKCYISYHQHQRDSLPESQAQEAVDCTRPGMEERCRGEEVCGHRAVVDSRVLRNEDVQQVREEQSPGQQHQHHQQLCVPTTAEQNVISAKTAGDHRNGRRSTSLEVSVTVRGGVSDVQNDRLSPSLLCTRRQRRSQSIPAELVAPVTSPYSERPTGCSLDAEATKKFSNVEPRHRRASDGVLCVVKETSDDTGGQHSTLLSYKTESEFNCGVMGNSRILRHGDSRDSKTDSGRTRVPVVCLERLKILVSQLPPHGRRQSDPSPAVTADTSSALRQQEHRHSVRTHRISGDPENKRTTQTLKAPLYEAEPSSTPSPTTLERHGRFICCKVPSLSYRDPQYVPQSSNPRSLSEDRASLGLDADPCVDSDTSQDSESSFEAELGCEAEGGSAAGEIRPGSEIDIAGDSEPSLEYKEDQKSDCEVVSEDNEDLNTDADSGDVESETDTQPEYEPSLQVDAEFNRVSDQPSNCQEFIESELDVDSEAEFTTDDPQPLRSDLEEESHVGRSPRPLLISNPSPQRVPENNQSEQDTAETESEDFCAVCLIGGELLCCDRCPKVFHLSCHVPPLLGFPVGDWLCSLCRDVVHPEVEYDCENEETSGEQTYGLSPCDQRKCERLTLLILSNILSAPFHEPVSPLARHYYQIIKRPMDLCVIRAKLQKKNPRHYISPDQFVADFSLMFSNCAKFNYPDSEVAQAGRSLVAFFNSQLKGVFPDRAFPAAGAESESDEYDEAYRTSEGGFLWPEKREQCYRKRKRRNSLKSRRHHF